MVYHWKIHKKQVLLLFVLLWQVVTLPAQVEGYTTAAPGIAPKTRGFDWSKVRVGGNFSLQFGSITYIEVSPLAGYEVIENTFLGLGATYIYYNDRYYAYETSIYGGRLFAQYFFEDILVMLHGEYEILNMELYGFNQRLNVDNVYVGGGYAEPLGAKSYAVIMLLWNVTQNPNSLYGNPVLRVSFIGGL